MATPLHGRRRAGRHNGRRDGRPDGYPAIDGLRRIGRPAAAIRPLRVVSRRVRLHVRRQLQGRAHGTNGHRVVAHVQHAERIRPGIRHSAVLPHRRHTAGHGRVRPRHNHRLRVRPRVVGVHVRRGAADRRVPDQGPDRRPRHRDQPVGDGVFPVPGHRQHQLRRHGHRGRVHRAPVGAAGSGQSAHRSRGPGATELRPAVRKQGPVADRLHQEFDNRGQLYRRELRVRQPRATVYGGGRGIAVQDHRYDTGGPAGFRAARVLRAARQRDDGLRRHGIRDEVERDRVAADRTARKHIHLQGVRARQHGGRDAGAVGHRAVQHRQLAGARFPGIRLVQPERREQRQRGPDTAGRTVHRGPGDRGPVVPDAALLLHTENVSGRGRYRRGSVHGGGARGETDLPVEEERPDPGAVHVFRLPVLAVGDRRVVRHRAEPDVHTVPRCPAEDLHTGVQDSPVRLQVSDADPGPMPGVPVRGLRAQPGHEAQSPPGHAGGGRLFPRVRRRLHRGQSHRNVDQRLLQQGAGVVLL